MKYIVGFLLMVFMLTPHVSRAQTTIETAYQNQLLLLIELLQQKVVLLQAELERVQKIEKPKRQPVVVPDEIESLMLSQRAEVVGYYDVRDAYDTDGIIDVDHKRYFTRFAELIPNDYHERFDEYVVYFDPDSSTDAFVETIAPYDFKRNWRLGISEDILRFDEDSREVNKLLIHEFGHVVSYDKITGVAVPHEISCSDYFMDRFGCPAGDSLLSIFVNQFWSERTLDTIADLHELRNSSVAIEDYYEENRNRFVSEYAVRGPEEDFAESFMTFVLMSAPDGGSVQEQKVLFFYNYPELISIRDEIRNNL